MRYILLSILICAGFLEAEGQQPPEGLVFNSNYVRIPNAHVRSNFKVYNGEITDHHQLYTTAAIIGTVSQDDTYSTFTPIVPFNQESPYTLVYDDQVFHFEIARSADHNVMNVTDIYPTTKEVPANILKWYVQFSKPVNPVKIYEHIHFLDQDGEAIDRSILHLGAPLLSEDGHLLTIWIEPGRQKRLLGPNRHLGSVFEPFQQYTLHIANTLKDAEGIPIETSVKHRFTTTASDRIRPSITRWEVSTLEADTRHPLEIISEGQLDYGSLIDALSILQDGQRIDGTISYNSEMITIYFTPKHNWEKGAYTIALEEQLEDLAGNNLRHLFDRPVDGDQDDGEIREFSLSVICE